MPSKVRRKTVNTPPHHPYGPSTMNSRAACPQWDPLAGPYEEPEDVDYDAPAGEGSLLHKSLELQDPSALSPAQLRLYDYCVEFTKPLIKPGRVPLREVRIPTVSMRHGFPGGSRIIGTADLVIVDKPARHAFLIDYKFGRLPVPPIDDNLQAMAYAIGVLRTTVGVDRVTVFFVQPRLGIVQSGEFRQTDLDWMIERVVNVVNDSEAKRGPFRPGPHCGFCARLQSCPSAGRAAVIPVADAAFPLESFDPASMTDEDLGCSAIPLAKLMLHWAAAVKDEAAKRLAAGRPVPGVAIKETTRLTDKLTGEDYSLIRELLMRRGVSVAEINEAVTIPVSAVNRLSEKAKRSGYPHAAGVDPGADALWEQAKVYGVESPKPQVIATLVRTENKPKRTNTK